MLKAFYVTMVRGQRVAYLAGPFGSKDEADPWVKPAQAAAIAISEWHHFDAFGVTSIERTQDALDGRPWFQGKLNQQLGIAA